MGQWQNPKRNLKVFWTKRKLKHRLSTFVGCRKKQFFGGKFLALNTYIWKEGVFKTNNYPSYETRKRREFKSKVSRKKV